MTADVKFTVDDMVRREVLHNLNTLMWQIGQNLEAASKLFDESYDDMIDWYGYTDYENAALEFVCGTDFDSEGDVNYLIDCFQSAHIDVPESSLDLESFLNALKESGEYSDLCSEANLDPERAEVYEHYAVTGWFANKLREKGEVVFEFADFDVWGRKCTGQAISLDSVINQIFQENCV